MTHTFISTCSRGYKASTLIMLVLAGGIVLRLLQLMHTLPIDTARFWLLALTIAMVMFFYGHAFLHMLQALEVNEEEIVILKRKGRIVIRRSDIIGIRPTGSIIWDTDLWGTDLIFGRHGWRYSKKLGKYFAMLNNSNLVVIITRKRKYVVSCDNREDFLALFQPDS